MIAGEACRSATRSDAISMGQPGKKGQGMCDGRCHCCCCKRHDDAGDGIGGLLVLLLAGVGLTAHGAYWLALMVADWLSAAGTVLAEYQTEILCVALGAVLVDLCLVTRKYAGHVAKIPLRRLPAGSHARRSDRLPTALGAACRRLRSQRACARANCSRPRARHRRGDWRRALAVRRRTGHFSMAVLVFGRGRPLIRWAGGCYGSVGARRPATSSRKCTESP
jgi:hypothetical protein